ncbi:MAG: ACP S-malonyltransferase [Dialister sp.]|nr:ACP S-malonyltransferase [Dialister sp.]MDD7326039.1 ACP S-malonyltransferase [Dialister sp.]MDY4679483.1 ACP S-malonyltransferase [Dialister sp.]MDY4957797.1 ACP S-malonyltransferase [Dialister sp.]
MKTAFLFPGQGSQKVGMVQDLFENYDSVKALIKEADETLGFSISKMMFEGPDTELMKTEFTQPAILTASVAVWQVLKEYGLTPDIAAGHSLGEYSALVAAGAISFADAVHTVHLRGRFMQEAVPLGEGGMAAVIGSNPETIVKVCGEVSTEDLPVQAVNFNCPGQVVIAGATAAVEKACEALKEAGARRAIMLKVSAPFHSTLMEPAALRLKEVLDKIDIHDTAIPVVANVNAKEETKADEIRKNLVDQAAHPVHWEESIRNMVAGGVDMTVEAGPGTVLTGFMKKIARSVPCHHAEDVATIDEVVAALKGE